MWSSVKNEEVPMPKNVKGFLNEYENICYKYGLSLSHEDYMGSFIIEGYSEDNIDWVKGANLGVC